LIRPQATTNYTETSGCKFDDSIRGTAVTPNCLRAVSANYNDLDSGTEVGDDPFTFGRQLVFAEKIWEKYNLIENPPPLLQITPLITSSWRNPERNEHTKVGGAFRSNHQWGSAFDLHPDWTGNSRFSEIYDMNDKSLAAWTWCSLAYSAWQAGGTRENIVENSRTGRPKPNGEDPFRFQFYWHQHKNPEAVVDADPGIFNPAFP